ncbi:hypothetical protein A6X21_21990 [Planctopirus hydrillae]|uniref:Uncharacterized protein n=1 Tax=Planctopirus hydrillae TaxID=1841610 RepID=A0A1C3EFG5_9PLAN|nr:hypothetical protein A6X21_21990 [Planctopirus hydrillae]
MLRLGAGFDGKQEYVRGLDMFPDGCFPSDASPGENKALFLKIAVTESTEDSHGCGSLRATS